MTSVYYHDKDTLLFLLQAAMHSGYQQKIWVSFKYR